MLLLSIHFVNFFFFFDKTETPSSHIQTHHNECLINVTTTIYKYCSKFVMNESDASSHHRFSGFFFFLFIFFLRLLAGWCTVLFRQNENERTSKVTMKEKKINSLRPAPVFKNRIGLSSVEKWINCPAMLLLLLFFVWIWFNVVVEWNAEGLWIYISESKWKRNGIRKAKQRERERKEKLHFEWDGAGYWISSFSLYFCS